MVTYNQQFPHRVNVLNYDAEFLSMIHTKFLLWSIVNATLYKMQCYEKYNRTINDQLSPVLMFILQFLSHIDDQATSLVGYNGW